MKRKISGLEFWDEKIRSCLFFQISFSRNVEKDCLLIFRKSRGSLNEWYICLNNRRNERIKGIVHTITRPTISLPPILIEKTIARETTPGIPWVGMGLVARCLEITLKRWTNIRAAWQHIEQKLKNKLRKLTTHIDLTFYKEGGFLSTLNGLRNQIDWNRG